jgi:hypothetical protein
LLPAVNSSLNDLRAKDLTVDKKGSLSQQQQPPPQPHKMNGVCPRIKQEVVVIEQPVALEEQHHRHNHPPQQQLAKEKRQMIAIRR